MKYPILQNYYWKSISDYIYLNIRNQNVKTVNCSKESLTFVIYSKYIIQYTLYTLSTTYTLSTKPDIPTIPTLSYIDYIYYVYCICYAYISFPLQCVLF